MLSNEVKRSDIIHINENVVTNTMEELFEIKKYLIDKNFNSVLIVTHPSHSKRIKILANLIAGYEESKITLSFVSADDTFLWDKEYFFFNKESILLVIKEIFKIQINIIKYNTIILL